MVSLQAYRLKMFGPILRVDQFCFEMCFFWGEILQILVLSSSIHSAKYYFMWRPDKKLLHVL